MSKEKLHNQRHAASGDVQSIRTSIQSLAHQLWVEKRDRIDGVDWLVDGRLRDELDELSKSELTRVNRLLARTIGKVAVRPRTMTSKSA